MDVVSVITEMGEYFKEEFSWKLENCTIQIRRRWKEKRNPKTHFRWSEPVGPFGLLRVSGWPPSSTPPLATSTHAVCERLGTGDLSIVKLRSVRLKVEMEVLVGG